MPAGPGITLSRPARHTVLRSFAGHLETTPDAAFRALAAHLGAPADAHALVDAATRTVVVQGDWWYRAEYRVVPEGDGTLLEHEIVNVAPTWHWAGPIAGRAVIRDAPYAFQALLTQIADAD